MNQKILPILWMLTAVEATTASAQIFQPPTGVQSDFETTEAPVLKVFSAEEGEHRFVSYLVEWKGVEVIVSDPLAQSHFSVGDTIQFMAHKASFPGSSSKEIATLSFLLLSQSHDEADMDTDSVSPEEENRLIKIVQGDLGTATNEQERFYALNGAAKKALKNGEVEEARALAIELESLVPNYRDDWNYGNAIHDANMVLGLIALSEDNISEAKQRLLASADSDGSPQMNSFGPNMQLASALLEKGETEVVLEYFNRCDSFWEMGKQRLAEWAALVKKGKRPNFGPNLMY